jgi:hypothetical protein
VALVLALGVFRLCRLIGWDDFPPIKKLRAKATGERAYRNTTEKRDEDILRYTRPILEHFITCPFCLGFWLSLAAFLAWRFEPTWTLYGLAPFALSGAVGLISKNLDP